MSDPHYSFDWTVPAGDAAGHIPLPCDPRDAFGRARPPVIVEVGGYAYRSTVAIMSGETFVPFRRSHREAADVRAGATVRVTLTLDTEVRDVAVPDDLSDALAGAGLREAWDRLSVTRRREQVEGLESARRPDTRARRLAAALAALRGG